MQRKQLLSYLAIGLALLLLSIDGFAQTTSEFASEGFINKANSLQNFLFGTPMKVAGVFGAAFGLFRSFTSQSFVPFIVFGGIGLAANLVPLFVDSVFNVSGMLIP